MSVQTTLFVLLFLLSLAFSAFFAGAETALVSLGPIDLQRLREKGDRRGAIIRALKTNRNRLLATILIGLMLIDLPGKRRLERKLVGRPRILRAINRLRKRFGSPPLVLGRRRGEVLGKGLSESGSGNTLN